MTGTLTVTDLFTPAPSGIGGATAPSGSWLETELTAAAVVGLPATAWQAGGMARTILALNAVTCAQQDGFISAMAQAGFLQWAATGTWTYTAANGTTETRYVTPDPSDPSQNPSGTLGWLDALAEQLYDVTRTEPTYANGGLYLANTTGVSIGPVAASQFHVAATNSQGSTYANTSSLTIPASTVTSITAGSVFGTTVSLTLGSVSGLAAGSVVYLGVLSDNGLSNLDNTWQTIVTVNTGTKVVTFTSTTASGTLTGTVTNGVYQPTSATFQADYAGPDSNAGTGQVSIVVSGYPGVACYNAGAWVGSNWESNTALAARCLLKLQSISPNGAAGAYEYVALSALSIYETDAIPVQGSSVLTVSLSQAITKCLVQSSTSTGVVTVTLANADGAPAGVIQAAVTGATNASPIVVTIADTTGLANGDYVYLAGVEGNVAANGYWQIANLTGTTFELSGSTGTGAWTSGGTVEGGDLGLVDLLINELVVPQAITETTQAASTLAVNIAATVTVPTAQLGAYNAAVGVALAAWFAALPIGGINGNTVPLSVIEGVLYAGGIVGTAPSYVQNVASLTLNSVASDVSLTTTQDATLGTVTLTLVGV